VSKNSLASLQQKIGEWSKETFPTATPSSLLHHLVDEVIELCENPGSPEEMADVLILLIHLASLQGIDLELATQEKFKVNQKRKWNKPDSRGVIKHIKEKKE